MRRMASTEGKSAPESPGHTFTLGGQASARKPDDQRDKPAPLQPTAERADAVPLGNLGRALPRPESCLCENERGAKSGTTDLFVGAYSGPIFGGLAFPPCFH